MRFTFDNGRRTELKHHHITDHPTHQELNEDPTVLPSCTVHTYLHWTLDTHCYSLEPTFIDQKKPQWLHYRLFSVLLRYRYVCLYQKRCRSLPMYRIFYNIIIVQDIHRLYQGWYRYRMKKYLPVPHNKRLKRS